MRIEHLIDGAAVAGAEYFETRNPATQEVLAQASYLSVDDRRLHFGLGEVASVDLEIRWPSGQRQSFRKVAADQLVTINDQSGIVPSQGFGRALK